MMKKSLLLLLCALMLISALACGKQPDQSTPDSSTSAESSGILPSTETEPSEMEPTATEASGETKTTVSGDKTTKTNAPATVTTKVVVNEEDKGTYPDFGGATIVRACYEKRPTLNGDTQNDARVYALEWAEKKYNCKLVYKVYDSSKMDEAFTAAALSNNFFADIAVGNCIGYVGWCQSGMLEPVDEYYKGRNDLDRWNMEIGRFQETHYGVDVYSSSIVWPVYMVYNETMRKELGLQDPKELAKAGNWDFETFREYCKKATNKSKGTYGVACFGLDSILSEGTDFEALVKGTKDGKTWYWNGFSHKESGSYDKALKILTTMQQLRNVDKSVLGDSTGGLQPVLNAEEAFSKGKVLFLVAGDARARTVRKAGMKNFSVVTLPTFNKGEKPKNSWVSSFAFNGFPKRSEKILKKASSKNISTKDLVAFWMDANTTWNKARGKAYYVEDFDLAISEKAADCLCSEADARFLYEMGKGMTYKVTYAATMETGNAVIDGLYMPVLLGQKTPAAAIKQTDANIQSYADKTWNKR